MDKKQSSLSTRTVLMSRYRSARYDIFLIFALTIVNLVLSFTDSNLYYLFSAEIPFFVLGIGRALLEKGLISSLTVPSVLSFVFCIPYLFFWIFSKKHYGCMIAALVYFSIDCVFLASVFTKELALSIYPSHCPRIAYLRRHRRFKAQKVAGGRALRRDSRNGRTFIRRKSIIHKETAADFRQTAVSLF